MKAARMPRKTPETLVKVLPAQDWSCVFLQLDKTDLPNLVLCTELRRKLPSIYLALLKVSELRHNASASVWVSSAIRRAGLPLKGFPSGYYLFHHGKLVGFHAAMSTLDEITSGAVAGLGVALILSWLGEERERCQRYSIAASRKRWSQGPGMRASLHFRVLIDHILFQERWEDSDDWEDFDDWEGANEQHQEEAVAAEFWRACELLGVGPDATSQQLQRAYHARARAWHSDRNPSADERMMKSLNAARDLYRARRGWA